MSNDQIAAIILLRPIVVLHLYTYIQGYTQLNRSHLSFFSGSFENQPEGTGSWAKLVSGWGGAQAPQVFLRLQ